MADRYYISHEVFSEVCEQSLDVLGNPAGTENKSEIQEIKDAVMGEVILEGEEAHHLIRVMRIKPGERLVLFDGTGAEYDVEVMSVRKKDLSVKILARRFQNRELAVPLTLAVALPKGERQRWLIEKITELGVSVLVPLQAERSVVRVGDTSLERLQRMVIEASKQCGRNTLMEISSPMTTREIFCENFHPEWIRMIAHPGGASAETVFSWAYRQNTPLLMALGPEGGFTDQEISEAEKMNWRQISLGPTILRTETAAVKMAAIHAFFAENAGKVEI
ncbi:MAG: RsmE family RNA methyltransferase [Planctomycetia bacterium]|nr:RsmE family RNA methyltransferase [Planctomycetia bacterium]